MSRFVISCALASAAIAVSVNTYAAANQFNPDLSLILSGTYANLSRSPADYALTGFIPSGEDVTPPPRGFSLAESELVASTNIDPYLHGQFTLSVGADQTTSVEEAWLQTLGLGNGLTLRAGRGFSGIGYTNEQHSHAWDFIDAPLAQKAFLGGQYQFDGVQLKWLAPTDLFMELGVEVGNGNHFPGAKRDKNGAGNYALFTHVGGDINESHSWRVGLSYLSHDVQDRSFIDNNYTDSFSGDSKLWLVDAIWKWAPNGNALQTNFKLQAEYYRRTENGTLIYDTSGINQNGNYDSNQSGWYLQGVYQFMPRWRAGLRCDRLQYGTVNTGVIDINNIPVLANYNPSRHTMMFDYSPSEFSRFRLQFAKDQSQQNVTDNEVMLQYNVSLGAHGAHKY